MYRISHIIACFIIFAMVASGCQNWSKTAKGGAVGAGAGAAIGGAIGSRSGNTATGAILGAAIGGVGGAAIGKYMDKQKKKLEEDLKEDATVERVGEGIKVTFESGILFDVNSADLKPAARRSIEKLAQTLAEYKETNIVIEGHTDATGSDDHNQKLSERRAQAVASYAGSLGVAGSRMRTKGYGESQPVASNDTESGKAQNRRVEVAIFANEKLKKEAADGKIE